jgi:hypothetical protein
MLSRLIYASEVTQGLTPEGLQALLTTARRCNRLHDISGMLVLDSRYFLQAVEGGREALSQLYSNLVRDPRHQRLVLLSFESIEQRHFSDWTMGFAAADASRRRLYLRHGSSARFDPYQLKAAGALALLMELSVEVVQETEALAA